MKEKDFLCPDLPLCSCTPPFPRPAWLLKSTPELPRSSAATQVLSNGTGAVKFRQPVADGALNQQKKSQGQLMVCRGYH